MSDKLDKEIADELRRIVGKGRAVLSGKVKSIDEGELTATVQLTLDDESALTDPVLLNVVTENTGGMYMIPAEGADCEVAVLDGEGKWTMLRASEYTKILVTVGSSSMQVKDGEILFNGGGLKGLVKLEALVGKISALEKDLNKLKTAFTNWIVAPNDGGAALKTMLTVTTEYASEMFTPTTNEDLENPKVKQ